MRRAARRAVRFAIYASNNYYDVGMAMMRNATE